MFCKTFMSIFILIIILTVTNTFTTEFVAALGVNTFTLCTTLQCIQIQLKNQVTISIRKHTKLYQQ
jgi:hypothetical protein